VVASADAKQFELKMARQALILLKNENNLLPLDVKKYPRILITGPMANQSKYQVSRYGLPICRLQPFCNR
jgi:beta-glucosidase